VFLHFIILIGCGRYITIKLLFAVKKQAEETNGWWVHPATMVVSLYTLTESESMSIEKIDILYYNYWNEGYFPIIC